MFKIRTRRFKTPNFEALFQIFSEFFSEKKIRRKVKIRKALKYPSAVVTFRHAKYSWVSLCVFSWQRGKWWGQKYCKLVQNLINLYNSNADITAVCSFSVICILNNQSKSASVRHAWKDNSSQI